MQCMIVEEQLTPQGPVLRVMVASSTAMLPEMPFPRMPSRTTKDACPAGTVTWAFCHAWFWLCPPAAAKLNCET